MVGLGPDDEGCCVLPGTSGVMLVNMLLCVLPVAVRSIDEVEVALMVFRVFMPVRMVKPLVTVPGAGGTADGFGTPKMDTDPVRSIVEAAFTSALAVGGKPKTLQMFAMAPNVAWKR